MIDHGNYDPAPEFCFEKRVTARSRHRCAECGYCITPGEEYERVTGKWDRRLSTYKTCLDCLRVRDWADQTFECWGWAFGHLFRDIQNELQEIYTHPFGGTPEPENGGIRFRFLRLVAQGRRNRRLTTERYKK